MNRGRLSDTAPMSFVYGRYRQPHGSVASGSGSTSGGRSSDRLGSASDRLGPVVAALEFSDGGDSHGAFADEDDMDRDDVGEQADSER